MEFTLTPDAFDQLVWAAKTAPHRPVAPILAGVRLTISDGKVGAETYDYTTHSKTIISAETTGDGVVVVPGKILAEIVRSLPKKTATFSASGGKLEVRCGASKFRLNTMPEEDYPTPPTAGDPIGCVSADTLFEAVNRVLVTASRDDTLPLLAAVKLEFTEGRFACLSTDRYRLSLTDSPWDGQSAELLVPAVALQEASKALTGEVEIRTDANLVTLSSPTHEITTTLVVGEYPPARRLIPEVTSTNAVVNIACLVEAVKRASILAERGTPVRLEFTEDTVTVSSGDADQQAVETLPLAEPLVGEPITTAFNPQFVLDALTHQPTVNARIGFTHASKPVLFTPDDGYSGMYTHLLVPVRVQ